MDQKKILANHWLFIQLRIFVDIWVMKVRLQLCLGKVFSSDFRKCVLAFPKCLQVQID